MTTGDHHGRFMSGSGDWRRRRHVGCTWRNSFGKLVAAFECVGRWEMTTFRCQSRPFNSSISKENHGKSSKIPIFRLLKPTSFDMWWSWDYLRPVFFPVSPQFQRHFRGIQQSIEASLECKSCVAFNQALTVPWRIARRFIDWILLKFLEFFWVSFWSFLVILPEIPKLEGNICRTSEFPSLLSGGKMVRLCSVALWRCLKWAVVHRTCSSHQALGSCLGARGAIGFPLSKVFWLVSICFLMIP